MKSKHHMIPVTQYMTLNNLNLKQKLFLTILNIQQLQIEFFVQINVFKKLYLNLFHQRVCTQQNMVQLLNKLLIAKKSADLNLINMSLVIIKLLIQNKINLIKFATLILMKTNKQYIKTNQLECLTP
ncbi:hypothetical protein TTHERM_000755999 (macronuclear) [Tetrahymena thermophila SB210]|uniref:Uncharacterized protein n=1 Tax=Tetrahymena thermophila (strain SB210) TaxID=312017 RepID=W7XFV3_TETTS|nr:hypothetical protein TTHERM_000755999 [Tetrahymena thermophila SB210]EWS71709.1 hypothetical protein TTHERM_000755999 [Tetrahymena thermophila SB210]|eukprot:XP_012655750.1 hypothetical protein TTHERM_000755999 [Tetrahymena thermophila SB210]